MAKNCVFVLISSFLGNYLIQRDCLERLFAVSKTSKRSSYISDGWLTRPVVSRLRLDHVFAAYATRSFFFSTLPLLLCFAARVPYVFTLLEL